MPLKKKMVYACVVLLFYATASYGQRVDSVTGELLKMPSHLFSKIQSRTAGLNEQLTKQTQKYLQRMSRQEERLKKQLYKIDSARAKELFANSTQQYAALDKKLKTDTGSHSMSVSGAYQPYADSLRGTLAFFQQNPQLLGLTGGSLSATAGKTPISAAGSTAITGITSKAPAALTQLEAASGQFQALQAKMQDAGQIQQYLQQRNIQIQQALSKYTQLPGGITNTYNTYKQQMFYYNQQVNEYKDMLKDPDKMFRTALVVLNKLPAFTSFMKSNSMLSGLLNMPGSATPGVGTAQTQTGLPARDQVLAGIQGQMGAQGPNASSLVQQNINSAQGQQDELRDKLNTGGNSADLDMPDFKPNGQKTKSFLHRFEYGVNLQTDHSSYYFPTTTDFGLSIGYKLNDHNRVGVGASYKAGWGADINHIRFSSQGVGLRSFLDIQAKKTWYASGGFEYNYQQPITSFHVLRDLSNWQQSGLIGVSKIISMKTKVFKNTKIQLLWDFLSYQQIPKTQPFQFRVGYCF